MQQLSILVSNAGRHQDNLLTHCLLIGHVQVHVPVAHETRQHTIGQADAIDLTGLTGLQVVLNLAPIESCHVVASQVRVALCTWDKAAQIVGNDVPKVDGPGELVN
jgi:hypothetical protein